MKKHILIVGNITEPIEIANSANAGKKDTSGLQKDNGLYIDVLDYYTNLIKIFFSIPGKELDIQGVDLIYKSTIDKTKKLIDIKTQKDVREGLILYMREFRQEKLSQRNYIIFNKENRKLFGAIYFVDAKFIETLLENTIFSKFLSELQDFGDLTQNYIEKDETLGEKFGQIKKEYNNQELQVNNHGVQIIFSKTARKDVKGIAGNTNFLENIYVKIGL